MPENEIERVNPPVKPKRLFWGHVGIVLTGIAAGILIAVILTASYALLAINHRLADALIQVTDHVNEAQTVVSDAQKTAQNAEQTMEQALKSQSEIIADLQKNQRTNKDDFLLGESHYLLKLAQDNLQYERNIPLAIKLLQSVDQDMAKISNPQAYPVREALAANITALQSVPQVDVTGVYVQLTALSEQIDKLPLMQQLLNHSETKTEETDASLPWWKRGLHSLGQALQRVVVVRKNLPNLPPFIAPEQQVFLYQNLHAKLATAQWALLHHQPEIYRLSLSQAEQWINQYAEQDSPITKQLLQSLAQLQKIDIYPSTPDISSSLQALQNYISRVS